MTSATFVVSLDFELNWGIRDRTPVEAYRTNLLGVREVVPALLNLFERYGIRSTWAVVGMCGFSSTRDLQEFIPKELPSYRDPQLSPYPDLAKIGSDEEGDPYHFAGSLLDQLMDSDLVEIASHTFSHYYCLEQGQTLEQFRADLRAARAAAESKGVSLRSLVFPRNQYGPDHLRVAYEEGFRAYRGNPKAWMYHPKDSQSDGLLRRAARLMDSVFPLVDIRSRCSAGPCRPVNIPATRFLRAVPMLAPPLVHAHLRRVINEIRQTAERGELYHLWWHPHNFGVELESNLQVLERILQEVDLLRSRGRMVSRTMIEIAEAEIEGHA